MVPPGIDSILFQATLATGPINTTGADIIYHMTGQLTFVSTQ
jgi:hypothetical protein